MGHDLDLDETKARQIIDEAGTGGDRAMAAGFDVGDAAMVRSPNREAIVRFGTLDGVANCPGVRGIGSILETTQSTWG